jgi:hypothetical protein
VTVPFRRLRRSWPVLLLVIPVVLLPIGVLTMRLCERPLDTSGSTHVPAWLARIKEGDDVAFPAHMLLGTLLQAAGCDGVASGLQWLKAAAHARSAGEIERSAAGLRAVAAYLGSITALDEQLCPFVASGYANARQRQAADQAGLVCGSP